MMRTRRSGYTLVELLIVSVLAAFVLGAVYETLIVQERSYAAGGMKMQGQESLRTAIGILESELREVGAIGDSIIGWTDFRIAADDSVVFRAQRKIGFVCALSRNEKWLWAWPLGDLFEGDDSLLVFVDNDSLTAEDDQWNTAVATSAQVQTSTVCDSIWPNQTLQEVKVGGHDMVGVRTGAPVRTFQSVTYGLYQLEDQGWALGRRVQGGPPRYLVGGLAPPGTGLRFTYYTPDGSTTNDPTQISRLRIEVRTDPPGNGPVEPRTLTSNLYLRNN